MGEVAWATLDLSGAYRSVFDTMLPAATQVADPFHLIRLANDCLDECRRRVQNETVGHRGRKHDPLYWARRLLTRANERLTDQGPSRLLGLLQAGDPHGEVRMAWHAKEVVREIYTIGDPDLADDSSPVWATISKTTPAPQRRGSSDGPCSTGRIRSSPGTEGR